MKKLIKKDENDLVNYGFLMKTLREQGFATKRFLLEQKYVTKKFLETNGYVIKTDLQKTKNDFGQHTAALAEHFQHQLQGALDAITTRSDAMEETLRILSELQARHDDRILRMENI